MDRIEIARQLRRALQMFVETLDDEKALEVSSVYPKYEELVLKKAKVSKGFRFTYQDVLYRTEQQDYTFDGVYAPTAGTESLYSKVALPDEGNANKPIEYNGNMQLENGKYYIQNGIVYLCNRDTGVPVYNDLKDLVGLYVIKA